MKPWGCHSQPRIGGYWAKNGIVVMDDCENGFVADQLLVWIEDTASKECQYRKTVADERCEGCTCP